MINNNKSEKKEINFDNRAHITKVDFKHPLDDVYTGSIPIAGCAWIKTGDGVVLIDTLLTVYSAKRVRRKYDGKVKYIIYTHGHMDHIGGAKAFLKDNPEIIASKYLPGRLDKYKMLAPHRARVNMVQFNIPYTINPMEYVYPTKTFLGELSFSLGDKTFELHTARGETDDAVWVYIPELKAAFIGDFMIGSFPNVGNPWKPTRFALDWAKTLEEIQSKDLDYLFYAGARDMAQGKQTDEILDVTIEAIRSLHDQVVDYINQGLDVAEIIHKVELPNHLKDNKYLATTYSRPEFFVYNCYRWYHGYFDGNPAHLLPRPEKEINSEIFDLIGDEEKILERTKQLFDQNHIQRALQVLDILIQADPENIEARKLRIELLETLNKNDTCLMSKNVWYYFIQKDKEFLESQN